MNVAAFLALFVIFAAIVGLFRAVLDGTPLRIDMQDARMNNLAARLTWLEDRAVLELREEDIEGNWREPSLWGDWPEGEPASEPCGIKLPEWEPWRY